MPNRAKVWQQMTDAQFYLCVEKRVCKGEGLDAAYEVFTQGKTIPQVLERFGGLRACTIRMRCARIMRRYNKIMEAFCNGKDHR